jgi:sulfotransferase family protein
MRFFMKVFSLIIIFQIFSYSQAAYARTDQKRVYLATYPRSGNHWLRGLLEEASHIATGSVYLDKEPMHLKTPFSWGYAAENGYEGNCRYPEKREVVVVKTHFPAKPITKFDLKPSLKVIRIVRHPLDAFYSHFLHQRANELPEDGKIPSWFVKKSVANWRKFEKYWNRQPNVLTIRYEDFYNNIHFHFQKIIETIGYPLSQEDINRAIDKFPPRGGLLKHLNDYHPEDLKFISDELKGVMKKYDYKI